MESGPEDIEEAHFFGVDGDLVYSTSTLVDGDDIGEAGTSTSTPAVGYKVGRGRGHGGATAVASTRQRPAAPTPARYTSTPTAKRTSKRPNW